MGCKKCGSKHKKCSCILSCVKEAFNDEKQSITDLFVKNLTANKINGVTSPNLCTTKVTQIYDSDFPNFSMGTDPLQWAFYDFGVFQSDDVSQPIAYNQPGGYLEIVSTPFAKVGTLNIPDTFGIFNRLHGNIKLNRIFPLLDDGSDFVIDTEIAVQCILGTPPSSVKIGMTNTPQDIRPSFVSFSISDDARLDGSEPSFMSCDTVFSNEDIYASHERLPFGDSRFGGTQNYRPYVEMIPIGKRNTEDPANDFVRITVAINRKGNYARWFINGVHKLTISPITMLTDRTHRLQDGGGPSVITDIPSMGLNVGTLTGMDLSNPVADVSLTMAMVNEGNNNKIMPLVQYSTDDWYIDPKRVHRDIESTNVPATYVQVGQEPYPGAGPFFFHVTSDNVGGPNPHPARLFGNGALVRLKYIRGYYVNTTCNKTFPVNV